MGAGAGADRSAGGLDDAGTCSWTRGTKHVLTRPRCRCSTRPEIAMEAAFGGAPQLATSAHIFRIALEFAR